MSRIVRADPYLTREDTGADEGRTPAVQHYEKQNGSDGATSNTVFTLSKPYVTGSNTLVIYLNGQKAELLVSASDETEYEETSSSTVTFGASLLDTDVVEFMVYGTYFIQDTDIYVTKANQNNNNIIINGDFAIWQRGTTYAAAPDDTYLADRWKFEKNGSQAHTYERSTSTPTTVESGHQSTYSLLIDCTTANASIGAGEYSSISQRVEGNTAMILSGGYATLSFWVRATLTGTYCVTFRNITGSKSYIHEYTVNATDTWEKKTVTVSFGADSGTWTVDTARQLDINFVIDCGSTYHGTANSWQAGLDLASSNQVNGSSSTDNNFRIAQVRLERGQYATPFVSRQIEEELALCYRFYHLLGDEDTIAGYVYSTTGGYFPFQFPVKMRGIPTLSVSSAAHFYIAHGAASDACTAISLTGEVTEKSGFVQASVASGLTVGQAAALWGINASASLAFDAEL